MIVEKQTVKSKSELQAVIQKTRLGKATIYHSVGQKEIQEIFPTIQSGKKLTVIIVEQ